MDETRRDRDRATSLYRLVVAGRVGEDWVEWFGADAVEPGDDRTVLLIRVADQAELFGRLRRVQDLNLRLLEVTLVPPGTEGDDNPHEHKGDTP